MDDEANTLSKSSLRHSFHDMSLTHDIASAATTNPNKSQTKWGAIAAKGPSGKKIIA